METQLSQEDLNILHSVRAMKTPKKETAGPEKWNAEREETSVFTRNVANRL